MQSRGRIGHGGLKMFSFLSYLWPGGCEGGVVSRGGEEGRDVGCGLPGAPVRLLSLLGGLLLLELVAPGELA